MITIVKPTFPSTELVFVRTDIQKKASISLESFWIVTAVFEMVLNEVACVSDFKLRGYSNTEVVTLTMSKTKRYPNILTKLKQD